MLLTLTRICKKAARINRKPTLPPRLLFHRVTGQSTSARWGPKKGIYHQLFGVRGEDHQALRKSLPLFAMPRTATNPSDYAGCIPPSGECPF